MLYVLPDFYCRNSDQLLEYCVVVWGQLQYIHEYLCELNLVIDLPMGPIISFILHFCFPIKEFHNLKCLFEHK